MPYIVTTRSTGQRPDDNPLGMWRAMAKQGRLKDEIVSRRAVATLDEARDLADDVTADHANPAVDPQYGANALNLPEPGGTIGPLPDGTVIEVQSVPWSGSDGMYALAGWDGTGPFNGDPIDAYNAAQ